jgi:hypothetical protein
MTIILGKIGIFKKNVYLCKRNIKYENTKFKFVRGFYTKRVGYLGHVNSLQPRQHMPGCK